MAWQVIERTRGPDGTEFVLYRFDDQYMIRAGGYELMSTRAHGSEEALARLACEALSGVTAPRVAIGGLGLGYTLKAALRLLPPGAELIVAELVPAIVRWSRQQTGRCSGWPLADPRVTVWEGDVGALLGARGGGFHAVILDVDNGPEALSWAHNVKLYDDTGIASIRSALAPADGRIRLFVSPKCEQLIRSFGALQYQKLPGGQYCELPEKDGVHDHVIDALRYFFVNHFGKAHNVKVTSY